MGIYETLRRKTCKNDKIRKLYVRTKHFRPSLSKLQDGCVNEIGQNTDLTNISPLNDEEENFCDSPDSGIDVAEVFEEADKSVSAKKSCIFDCN